MKSKHHKELFDKGLVTKDQHDFIEIINSAVLVSVFYELRTLLYLGVLAFSTGIGILIYKNVGEFGHIISILTLFALTVACFWYVFSKRLPFSTEVVQHSTPYYDYVLLLGSLLLIIVQGYIEYRYSWFSGNIAYNSLFSALVFFYLAYRFDHLGVLSLGITALGAFLGIKLSPADWQRTELYNSAYYYNTGIVFSAVLSGSAILLYFKNIKKHFLFTYIHFAVLLFLFATTTAIFENNALFWLYVAVQVVGIFLIIKYALWQKTFVFMIYSFIFGYITLTYFAVLADIFNTEMWFFYFMFSCGMFVLLILKFRKYFKEQ